MSAFDTAKEIVRIGSTAGLSKDVIDLLEKKLALITGELEISQRKTVSLESQMLVLTTKATKLEIENRQLRAQLHNSPPVVGALQESMGVLWKRTATGFEPHPYCNECAHHPVMFANPPPEVMDPMFWQCSSNHKAPYSAKPPA